MEAHDADLTAPAATVPGGPNDPHPDDPEGLAALEAEERAATEAAAEATTAEREEQEWPADEDEGGIAASPEQDEDEPQASPQGANGAAASVPSTAPPAGEATPAPEPEPDPEPNKSGAATRPYYVLEQQLVVPFHVLTEAQQKSYKTKAESGFIPRPETVVARNAEHALGQVYPVDPPDYVTGVLPISKANYKVGEVELEPVPVRSRLKFKR